MYCEYCGKEIRDGGQFCTNCGHSIEVSPLGQTVKLDTASNEAFCSACGARIEADAKYCDACGAPVTITALPVIGSVAGTAASTANSANVPTGLNKKTAAIIAAVVAVIAIAAIVAVLFTVGPLKPDDSSQDVTQDNSATQEENENSTESEQQQQQETKPSEEKQSLVAEFDDEIDTPFWGVFTYASKSYSEADEAAQEMTDAGFESGVLDTADWEKLNSEPWYVVCTGVWDSEDDAKKMASELKDNGHTDAYAKYTGEYADGTDAVKLSVKTAKGERISSMVHRDSDDYVIADSSSYAYSESELEDLDLTDAELCIAWNEPFARLGHHFDNPDLQDYFESCSWYTDNHKKYNLSGTAAANNSKLRKIAEKNSSSKRWEDLATK